MSEISQFAFIKEELSTTWEDEDTHNIKMLLRGYNGQLHIGIFEISRM